MAALEVAEEVDAIQGLFVDSKRSGLWTHESLATQPAWRAVRRLSRICLAAAEWPLERPQLTMEALVAAVVD